MQGAGSRCNLVLGGGFFDWWKKMSDVTASIVVLSVKVLRAEQVCSPGISEP